MNLSFEDAELFYKLHWSLLFYVNKKLNILKNLSSPNQFKKTPYNDINKIREALYERSNFIDSFVKENPSKLSPDELEIVAAWNNYINKSFIILKPLKKYTIFLDEDEPPKAYGVLGLKSRFDEMFGFFPIMVNATLLPFKGKIIYDGIVTFNNVIFGSGIKKEFNYTYREAKTKFGIITSLPFSTDESKQTDADKLRFYLRDADSREDNHDEIMRLISSDDDLFTLYHQEMGKIDAKFYNRRLRKIGLKKVWFAILQGNVIASGSSKEKLENTLREILPEEKMRLVYVYQLK